MTKTAILTGGGTAGHIYPALALAETLRDRGWDVYYAGTPDGIEAKIVPDAGVPFKAFVASGFDRAHPTTLVTGIVRILGSTRQAKGWFDEVRPDVVVGFGGYVSIPVARAAEGRGIPVVVHEQNSVMGMANKYIAKRAASVCLTYDEARVDLEGEAVGKAVLTGNPVRASVMSATREEGRRLLGVPEDATMLLVFGGSKGARHINEAIVSLKDELLSVPDLFVVHITGPSELDSVKDALGLSAEEEARYVVMGYQDRMAQTLAAADVIVSRAGATSLAEIAARGIPAILVPYPYARGDHQTTNARSYASSGAAHVVADADIDDDAFRQLVMTLVTDPSARSAMHEASQSRGTEDAASRLADQVEAACAAIAR